VNREFRIWDLRYYAIGVLAFIIAQLLLIAGLFLHRRRRRMAEESLRQRTEELNQFFNVSLDLMCIANTDGYFLRLNPIWERILGYSRDELMSKRFTEFVHPDDVRGTTEAVAALVSQKAVTYFMNRYRCKDGTYRWLEWSAAPTGSLIYADARDVTERKRAEEALQERLRFEQLLSDLSARFMNISPDRVDSEIEYGLKQILEFFKVDRVGLVRTLPGRSAYQITHVAYSEDVPPVPAGAQLPISINPWAYEKLIVKREVAAYSRLDDLPPEASVDKQTWAEWGIRSNVNIPILIGESVDHIISINSVKSERVWPEELFPRLQLLGEIFVNALERRHAQEASRESERMLRQNENDLRRLAGRLIYAQEEERSRLARELHDDLAQRLAVFAINVGKLEQQLVDPSAPVQEGLREMEMDIVKISQDVHSLSRQLHPSILDDLGLIKAVESECTEFSRREGIEIVFDHENIPTVIPKDVSLSLYRIIQEGLSNISKHACADHISVSLKGIDHDVLLSVRDDGIGFDSAEVKEKPGLGLSSMGERARLMHGDLSIKSQPEKGTVITVRVPLKKEGE
jgi:PAS domain S-box-containing protein